VCAREFFKLLRVSTLKFEKVCGKEFFELLRVSTLKFEKVWKRVLQIVEGFNVEV
jgi:hypothetical protein